MLRPRAPALALLALLAALGARGADEPKAAPPKEEAPAAPDAKPEAKRPTASPIPPPANPPPKASAIPPPKEEQREEHEESFLGRLAVGFLSILFESAVEASRQDLDPGEAGPWRALPGRRALPNVSGPPVAAWEGLLLSFAGGGGGQRTGPLRGTGAFDAHVRAGRGFSNQLQLQLQWGASWAGRGEQSSTRVAAGLVLVQALVWGEPRGSGLSLGAGGGLASVWASDALGERSSGTAPAVTAIVAFDLRTSRDLALSPELFVLWSSAAPAGTRGSTLSFGLRLGFRLFPG